MKKVIFAWGFLLLGALIILTEYSCSNSAADANVEKLVATYCGRCHHVPDPASLTKSIWEKNIMKKMSEYYKWSGPSRFRYANRSFYLETGTIPMSDTIWAKY